MDPSGKPIFFPTFQGMGNLGMYGDYGMSGIPVSWPRPPENRNMENRYTFDHKQNMTPMTEQGERVDPSLCKKTDLQPTQINELIKEKFPSMPYRLPENSVRYTFDQPIPTCSKKPDLNPVAQSYIPNTIHNLTKDTIYGYKQSVDFSKKDNIQNDTGDKILPMAWNRHQFNYDSQEHMKKAMIDFNGQEIMKKLPENPTPKDKFSSMENRALFNQEGTSKKPDHIPYTVPSTSKVPSQPWTHRPPENRSVFDLIREPIITMEVGETRQLKFSQPGNAGGNQGSIKKPENVPSLPSLPNQVPLASKEKFECLECGKHFAYKSTLATHSLLHSDIRPFECVDCGKRFSRSCQLAVHSAVHTGEKRYECHVCRKKFSQSGNLKRHLVIHTGEKNYSCPECGKMFARQADITQHASVHSGEKPYQCDSCEKAFRTRSNLCDHIAFVHTKVKKFECQDCGKMFPRNSDLKQHSIIHTRTEKVSCSGCGKQYARNRDLIKHKQKHLCSKKSRYECTECGIKFARKWDLTKHALVHSGMKLALVSHLMRLQHKQLKKQKPKRRKRKKQEDDDDDDEDEEEIDEPKEMEEEEDEEEKEKDDDDEDNGEEDESCSSDPDTSDSDD